MQTDAVSHSVAEKEKRIVKAREDGKVHCLVVNMTISAVAARRDRHYSGGVFAPPGKEAAIIRPSNQETCNRCGHACTN